MRPMAESLVPRVSMKKSYPENWHDGPPVRSVSVPQHRVTTARVLYPANSDHQGGRISSDHAFHARLMPLRFHHRAG